jgi:hypothetical protein
MFITTFTILSLCMILPMPSAIAEEDIWTDEPASRSRRFDLTDERVDRILKMIGEKAPERAEELKRLRKKDPEKFKEQIRAELAKMQPPERGRPEGSRPDRDSTRRRPGEPPARDDAPGSRGQRRGGRWRENMQKSHEEYIKWLERNYPDEAQTLQDLQEKDPEQYFRSAFASRRKYGRIMEAEKRNPELAEVLKEDLEIQSLRVGLLKEVNQVNGKKREEIVKELESLVSRRFDLIVRKKQLQYQDLQKRLEKMQEELKQRQLEVKKLQDSKEKAIEDRVKELIDQGEKVKWE